MGLYIQEIKGHLGQVEWACEVEGGVQQVGLDGKRRGPTKIGVGLSWSSEETVWVQASGLRRRIYIIRFYLNVVGCL